MKKITNNSSQMKTAHFKNETLWIRGGQVIEVSSKPTSMSKGLNYEDKSEKQETKQEK